MTAPVSDPRSTRVFNLIFNGLTYGISHHMFMSLSERMQVSEVIYETLRAGGVEFRLADGLQELRDLNP